MRHPCKPSGLAFLPLIVALVTITGCQPPDPAAELKPITDAYVEAWNSGNLDGLDAIMDPQFERRVSPASGTGAIGIDALKEVIAAFRTQFPDFRVVLDEEIFAADRAIARWTFTGTNTGPGDFPPTGRAVTLSGTSIIHLSEGRMVTEWVQSDNLHLFQQLGFTLSPPEGETE
ncbi:MAG: hypothetical protein GTN62_07035 [Gemmatimonadales bacterium]|nr:hypothetical protein [Gemmatimonadales bacterium]NIN11254.1 hypothetical protein [Gemmatimonadales bacterium]NIN49853.1 hypothetical protein [Gemmatimonadales bacterium]NIP07317.1 hypothetical protein [Gemmatimonadales bacterium]NIR03012.1 hypothetical protein [Gemmatimonadales bacterium]